MATCKVCNSSEGDLEFKIKKSVIEMIRKQNPDWQEEDGSCARCVEHYKELDNSVEIID